MLHAVVVRLVTTLTEPTATTARLMSTPIAYSAPAFLFAPLAHLALQEHCVLTALWDTLETVQSARWGTEVLVAPLAPQTITPPLLTAPPAQPSTATASPAADQPLASLAP